MQSTRSRTAYLETRAAERARVRGGVRATVQPLGNVTMAGATRGPVPKERPLQHGGYMEAVRSLGYCMLCHRACRPQFCHADEGKGVGIKTDVRRGWPGCGPGEWGPGCHYIVGSTGQFTKQERRELEELLARKTRAAVIAAGTWPARLPMYEEPPCDSLK